MVRGWKIPESSKTPLIQSVGAYYTLRTKILLDERLYNDVKPGTGSKISRDSTLTKHRRDALKAIKLENYDEADIAIAAATKRYEKLVNDTNVSQRDYDIADKSYTVWDSRGRTSKLTPEGKRLLGRIYRLTKSEITVSMNSDQKKELDPIFRKIESYYRKEGVDVRSSSTSSASRASSSAIRTTSRSTSSESSSSTTSTSTRWFFRYYRYYRVS